MKHVTIPITSIDGSKDLTPDQRNLLIILEDATLMFVRDEIQFLRSLPEIMRGSKLTDSYCVKVLSVIERRMKQLCRGCGKEKTEQYETALLEAVDGCDTERADLKREIRTGQTQPVQVWHLVAKDTVDEGVLRLLQKKDKTNKRVEAATK